MLDRGLPDGDGLALLQRMRSAGLGIPCLVLASSSSKCRRSLTSSAKMPATRGQPAAARDCTGSALSRARSMWRRSVRTSTADSSGLVRVPACDFRAEMCQTFMPNNFSALRNAIFSLSSRGRSTARNQSVPSLMLSMKG